MQRLSLILSTLALVVAVTGVSLAAAGVIVTSKQIKNGTIISADIHKSGVKSSDVANGTISSPDIGNGDVASADIGEGQVQTGDIGSNQVTPSDVQLPAPVETTPNEASGPVTSAFSKLATVATVTKVQAESTLEVTWSGAIASGPGTNCVFQLRVNGVPSSAGGGEAFSQGTAVNVSTTGAFTGLPAGEVSVEVWARESAAVTPTPTCTMGPANPGIETTIVAIEQVV